MNIHAVNIPPSLTTLLHVLHDRFGKEMQTIRGGTQVDLATDSAPQVSQLMESLAPVFGDMKPCGLWSVRMKKGGYHVRHNHPRGVMSGVCYLEVGEGADLEIGSDVVKPKPGMVVVFSSITPHGTTVYEGENPRLTVSFDLR